MTSALSDEKFRIPWIESWSILDILTNLPLIEVFYNLSLNTETTNFTHDETDCIW